MEQIKKAAAKIRARNDRRERRLQRVERRARRQQLFANRKAKLFAPTPAPVKHKKWRHRRVLLEIREQLDEIAMAVLTSNPTLSGGQAERRVIELSAGIPALAGERAEIAMARKVLKSARQTIALHTKGRRRNDRIPISTPDHLARHFH